MSAVWDARFAPPPPRAQQRVGAVVAVVAHAAVIALLLTHEPARRALLEMPPIMVSLISPEQPRARSEAPKPAPVARAQPTRTIKPPLMAAPVEAPSPITVAAPAQTPSPVVPSPAPPQAAAPAQAATQTATQPVTQAVFDANYLGNPAAVYPAQSLRLREQGRVVLRVLVSSAGRADEVQIRTSSGSSRLDDAARETVQRWRFVPARRGTEAVSDWVLVPVSFNLKR